MCCLACESIIVPPLVIFRLVRVPTSHVFSVLVLIPTSHVTVVTPTHATATPKLRCGIIANFACSDIDGESCVGVAFQVSFGGVLDDGIIIDGKIAVPQKNDSSIVPNPPMIEAPHFL
jgi:hypothetical protein